MGFGESQKLPGKCLGEGDSPHFAERFAAIHPSERKIGGVPGTFGDCGVDDASAGAELACGVPGPRGRLGGSRSLAFGEGLTYPASGSAGASPSHLGGTFAHLLCGAAAGRRWLWPLVIAALLLPWGVRWSVSTSELEPERRPMRAVATTTVVEFSPLPRRLPVTTELDAELAQLYDACPMAAVVDFETVAKGRPGGSSIPGAAFLAIDGQPRRHSIHSRPMTRRMCPFANGREPINRRLARRSEPMVHGGGAGEGAAMSGEVVRLPILPTRGHKRARRRGSSDARADPPAIEPVTTADRDDAIRRTRTPSSPRELAEPAAPPTSTTERGDPPTGERAVRSAAGFAAPGRASAGACSAD